MRTSMTLKDMFEKLIFENYKTKNELLELAEKVENKKFEELDSEVESLMETTVAFVEEEKEEHFLEMFSKIIRLGAKGKVNELEMIEDMYNRKN